MDLDDHLGPHGDVRIHARQVLAVTPAVPSIGTAQAGFQCGKGLIFDCDRKRNDSLLGVSVESDAADGRQ